MKNRNHRPFANISSMVRKVNKKKSVRVKVSTKDSLSDSTDEFIEQHRVSLVDLDRYLMLFQEQTRVKAKQKSKTRYEKLNRLRCGKSTRTIHLPKKRVFNQVQTVVIGHMTFEVPA